MGGHATSGIAYRIPPLGGRGRSLFSDCFSFGNESRIRGIQATYCFSFFSYYTEAEGELMWGSCARRNKVGPKIKKSVYVLLQ